MQKCNTEFKRTKRQKISSLSNLFSIGKKFSSILIFVGSRARENRQINFEVLMIQQSYYIDPAKEQSMTFSSKVIGKTLKSQFKIKIYMLKYLVEKTKCILYERALCAHERAHMRAASVLHRFTER